MNEGCFPPRTSEKNQSAIRLNNILTIKQHESITPGGKYRKNSSAKIISYSCFVLLAFIARHIFLVKQEFEFLIPVL